MAGCPYTWVRSFLGLTKKATNSNGEATSLRVTVDKDGVRTVDVYLPARSARWLMELIPSDVMTKIRAEKIPIDDMHKELEKREVLHPEEIFSLKDANRTVSVWLE